MLVVVLTSLVASCASTSDGDASTTTDRRATIDTSATSVPTSGSGSVSPTEGTDSTGERAEGSGCTPPSATALGDGRWYGLVEEAAVDALSFDLACFFVGEAAVAAAASDGAESPPPNDYHVRNTNGRLRTLAVDPETPVTWFPDGGDPADVTTGPYRRWRMDRDERAFDLAVWLTIEGGRIVGIDEQWVP